MNKILTATASVLMGTALMAGAQDEWDTNLNAGLNMTDGNSETLSLNVGLTTERGDDDNFSKLGAEYNYGETSSETTVENVKAYGKQRTVLSGDTYGYGSLDYLRDDVADVDYRFIVGLGVGQYLIRNDKTTMGLEGGLSYVIESVDDSDNYLALRIAEYSETQLSETAKVFQSVEYLPEASDFDNYLINAEVGVEAAINDSLALRVVFQDRYDSTPASGNDENDLALIAGITYAL